MNGLLEVLAKLRKEFDGKFIITTIVKNETIDRPLQIKKYELAALKIKKLLEEKILEMPEAIGIQHQEIEKDTIELMSSINHVFLSEEKWMEIVHKGEASCIALSKLASKRGIQNAIAIDERTTRMLCEKPRNLHQLYESKTREKITFNEKNAEVCQNIKFIRSAELFYIAYKKGLIEIKDPQLLDALLYGAKFKGCAIAEEEILDLKRMK